MPVLVLASVVILSATISGSGSNPGAPALLLDGFDRPNGVITNEYAYWNRDKRAIRSEVWQVSSGSLFARDRHAWTGAPDARRPNVHSSAGTGSAVFRLTTHRTDFQDVRLSFRLLNLGLRSSARTPTTTSWTGVHVFLRYQSEFDLYVVSVNRRDNAVVIKKKVPNGPSNGGTYHTLASGTFSVPYGRWQHVSARTRNTPEGFVEITLDIDGRRLLETTDTGWGGAPITAPGRIGIRGDYCQFMLDDVMAASTL